MSENEEQVRAFHVEYYDEWLGVEDFQTVRAADEDTAREQFEEDTENDRERYEFRDVTEAYALNKSKIDEILG